MRRSYHLNRPATSAERVARYRAHQRAAPCSLERIRAVPPTRAQRLAAAAMGVEQFGDWPGRLDAQRLREALHEPASTFDTWITYEADERASRWTRTDETTHTLLFKDGKRRRVPVARAVGPARLITITPELEKHALEAIARIARGRIARGRRRR